MEMTNYIHKAAGSKVKNHQKGVKGWEGIG